MSGLENSPDALRSAQTLPCPHCGLVVEFWTSRRVAERRGEVTIQAISHALPACQGFRDEDDPQVFIDLARLKHAESPAR